MAILNTHAVVKKFTQHGFTEEHAELIVDTINDQSDQLATKNDLAMLKTEIKADIIEVKTDLKKDISDIKSDLAEMKTDILKWMIPFFLTIIGLIITAFFKH